MAVDLESALRDTVAPDFAPLRMHDGYLPIRDHGLISDGSTAALVGRDGAVSWLCVPRFDSPALFCRILDARKGGALLVAPDDLAESRQYYIPDSGILVTDMRGPSGTVRVIDALTMQAGANLDEGVDVGRNELLRSIHVLAGRIRLRVEIDPRGGCQSIERGDGWHISSVRHPDLDLQLYSDRALQGAHSTIDLRGGERMDLSLSWGTRQHRYHALPLHEVLQGTLTSWQRWAQDFSYEGPRSDLVRRSGITLKMLDHFATGAIVAAPTSSLPEAIGGPRNWDYRYSWIRDAAFSVYAFRRIGMKGEASAFLAWVLDDVENTADRPNVLYDLDGRQPEPEWEDADLEGYRGSAPVRWGNGAAEQRQHDVFGELMDCAYQWVAKGGEISLAFWEKLRGYVETARREWRQPDHGIWEVRTSGQIFTYSAALCHVALDRGVRIAERMGLPCDIDGWRADAARIRDSILEEAWCEEIQSLTGHFGGRGLDASLLTLPLRRIVTADHPRMIATSKAIDRRLGAGNGLLFRYLPDESPDGLPGEEGAFLLCSFWMVDNLALQGRLDEALEMYESLCDRAGPLGLLPEQIDPASGAFLGNYPQAFSHVGVISSGVTLARLLGERDRR